MLKKQFKKIRVLGIVASVLVLGVLAASPAGATLIQANDGAFGAGDDGFNLTQDTNTGLEWLDLTLSTNFSYNDIAGGAGGFLAAGFSIATGTQVDTFFINSGATDLFDLLLAGQFAAAQNLINLLGCTVLCGSGSDASTGIADKDPFSATDVVIPFVQIFQGQGKYDGSFNCCTTKDDKSEFFGVYLVRSIPEPATFALFAFGLAALGFMVRRRRRVAVA